MGEREEGTALITAERRRQVTEEGWLPEHDDGHKQGELAVAAACYAMPELLYVYREVGRHRKFADPWPWPAHYDKRPRVPSAHPLETLAEHNRTFDPPSVRIRELVKAGALIAAEIDRLRRAAPAPGGEG